MIGHRLNRVCHVALGYPPSPAAGGIATAARMSALAAKQVGSSVTFLCSTTYVDKERTELEARKDGIDVLVLASFQRKFAGGTVGLLGPRMSSLRQLDRVVSGSSFVHLHGYRNGLVVAAAICSIVRSVPYAVQPHGSAQVIGKNRFSKRVFDLLIGRRILRRSAAVLVLGRAERAQVAALSPAIRIEYVINPVFRRKPVRRTPVSARPIRVLFVGRLNWKKGVDWLVSSWPVLRQAASAGAYLSIVGPDDGLADPVRTACATDSTIDWVGALSGEQLESAYEAADLVIVPSITDTFPMVILEAASFGCAIAASAGVEIAEDGRDLMHVFDVGDEASVAELMSEPTAIEQLWAKSAALVERYGVDELVAQLEPIYSLGEKYD